MMNTQPTYQSGYSSPVFSNVRKSTVSSVSTIIMTLPNVSNETIPKGMPSIFRRDSQMPCTINDKEWAEQLMSTHNPGSQVDYFTYKDSTAVLALVAEGSITNATPGLVAALLEYDADVNLKRRKSSSLWKRISDKDQSDIRSNLLELATQNCSSQILLLLSPGADETSANQALPHAIMQNDLEKINILLARGANASSLCTQFAHIIETGSAEVTAKLMSRTQGACQACRDKGLIRAATLGLAEKVAILLKNGADVLFENAAALLAAIHHGWDDVAAAMVCKGGSDIPVQLLDGALGDAYGKGLLRTVEACLEAGAKGINTNTTLVDAVRRGHLGLVENLVRHGAAVDHDSGAAVVSAVQSGQPELLRVVLNGMPCSATLAAAIVHSPKLGHIQVVQQMIGLLLVAGSRGVAVDQVLLQVVDKRLLRGEERIRLSLVHLLLTKGGANVNVQSGTCMRVAAQEGWLTILNELLQCQPSLESRIAALQSAMQLQAAARKRTVAMVLKSAENDLAATHKLRDAAVTLAAKSLHIDILEYLTYSALPPTTVQAGLDSVTSTGSRWLSPAGLQVVQFFLSRGVSGKSVEHAFYQAAIAVEQDAVEMLVTFIKSKSVLNLALMGMADHSVKWLSVDDCNIWLVASLLEWGAYGDSINQAFLKAVHAYTQGKASKTLLDLLLRVGKADVNYMSGEVLMVAVRSGDVQLVTHLASLGATKDSMTRAFSQAIRAPLEETIVLELIQALLFDKDSSSKPDLVVVLPDRWPHIFECLYAHPNSVKLVKRLAELGCDIDAEINTEIYDKIKERSNALSWALRQYHDGPIISSQTIEALIELKVNVCFTGSVSRTTPLILAAKYCRSDIVKRLIKTNVDTSARDRYDRSALFHASSVGDLQSVKYLLKSKYKVNDGSLHEAARNLHSDVVAALLKGSHDPNFPSSRPEHSGRTPLQELAYRCQGTNRLNDIEDTIVALYKGKADPLRRWREDNSQYHGKNSLFLALDNVCPLEVTQALLDTIMWQHMDNVENVVTSTDLATGITFTRSANIYLRDFKENSKQTWQLTQLLQTKGCTDRMYAQFGAFQPPNAIGLPDDIAKEDKRRRAEMEKSQKTEAEHREKLRRIEEESNTKLTMDQSKFEAWQAQEYERAIHKVGSAAIIHENQLHQKAQLTAQEQQALALKNALQQRALDQKNATTEQHKVRTAFVGQAALQHEQQLKLNFAQQTADQKAAAQKNQNYLAQQAAIQKVALQKTQNNLAKQAGQQKLANQRSANQLAMKARR